MLGQSEIEKIDLAFPAAGIAQKGLLQLFFLLVLPASPLAISNPEVQGLRLREYRCHHNGCMS
ncbi:MAG: hypothetical protein BWX44_00426 [Spirochaetes bacterium ADurb.Bin001]|nr:MAG: hypothetical protein BWX44_00426 [Spirochaetes bacterium ADurb.Bin001]